MGQSREKLSNFLNRVGILRPIVVHIHTHFFHQQNAVLQWQFAPMQYVTVYLWHTE